VNALFQNAIRADSIKRGEAARNLLRIAAILKYLIAPSDRRQRENRSIDA
jgi:hypothetical protein